MTHEFLDAPRLRAVCDMQREQIRLLRRQLAERDAHNRRLQEQVCDGMNMTRGRCELLRAVQAAYRKHQLDDPSIGWDELGEVLHTALVNAMGPDGYLRWVEALQEVSTDEY